MNLKTVIILVISAAVSSFPSFAQTNTAWSTTGNIGIGTTSPSTELEVDGEITTNQITTTSFGSLSGELGAGSVVNGGGWLNIKGAAYNAGIPIFHLTNTLYIESGDNRRILETRNLTEDIIVGQISSSGDEAPIYLGGTDHYIKSKYGDGVFIGTNGQGLRVGELTGSGSEAPIYLGDGNHFIKSSWGEGITIGTFGASTGIFLKESSGNVGIGTSSPTQKLHVVGGARVTSLSGSGNRMVIADADGDLSTQSIPVGDDLGNHTASQNLRLNGKFLSNDGGNEGLKVTNAGLVTLSSGLIVNAGSSAGLTVSTGAINLTSGNLNISTSDDVTHDLNVGGRSRLFSEVGIGGNSQASWELTVHGDAQKSSGGTSWDSFSDKRLKNIEGSVSNAVETIEKLNPIVYSWNNLRNQTFGEDRPGQKFGFIAQELAKVIPEFVFEGEDGYLRYNPSGIEAILVAAIQEQSQQLDTYKEELAVIKHELQSCCSQSQQPHNSNPEHIIEEFKSVLHQNRPNPFKDRTIIDYSILDEFISASIIVTDLNGQQLLSFNELSDSKGSVSISNEDLYSGVFLYSLVLDGEIVDTKRMVVTR